MLVSSAVGGSPAAPQTYRIQEAVICRPVLLVEMSHNAVVPARLAEVGGNQGLRRRFSPVR